ncbi:MAG: hypothetical protein IT204_23975, partial [Fimbriimonadaceae bacterium]|nr:hypothetical protein [Fimbriimonadaceae bacterium]
PPPLTVTLRCAIDDTIVSVSAAVQYRRADSHYGEQRQVVQVQPALQATVRPAVLLLREQMASYPVAVDLRNTSQRDVTGTLRLLAGERELARQQVSLGAGRQEALSLPVVVDGLTAPTTARLVWQPADGGRVPLSTVHRIAYPHIATRLLLTPAQLRLVPGEVAVDPAARVGYFAGAADELGEALRQLGYQPRLIDPATLAERSALEGLTCLVIGARAYETQPELVTHNARLLAWVAGGGRLLVLYQRHAYTQANLAPFALTTATPHDRVTDETAAVRLLQPDHALLRWPNRLGDADFAGWVQERGLYFQRTWDPHYTALLACADAGQDPAEGGLLTAAVERGQYTYCGYALHRQWSAGVLGAWRLLANLTASAAP